MSQSSVQCSNLPCSVALLPCTCVSQFLSLAHVPLVCVRVCVCVCEVGRGAHVCDFEV